MNLLALIPMPVKHQENIRKASGNIGKTSESFKQELNDTQRKILDCIKMDSRTTIAKMSEQIGISTRNIETNLRTLKEAGIITRHGTRQNGFWQINE
jgi:ATP-dependent DNA helicase RecG